MKTPEQIVEEMRDSGNLSSNNHVFDYELNRIIKRWLRQNPEKTGKELLADLEATKK